MEYKCYERTFGITERREHLLTSMICITVNNTILLPKLIVPNNASFDDYHCCSQSPLFKEMKGFVASPFVRYVQKEVRARGVLHEFF